MSLKDSLNFKGSSATQLLRDQHLRTVETSEAFLANNLEPAVLIDHVRFILEVHIPLEDNILIPAFRPYLKKYLEFEEPIRIISAEHRSLMNTYRGIANPVSFEEGTPGVLTSEEIMSRCESISRNLLQHIYKEENGLFSLIEQYMPEDVKREVTGKITSDSARLAGRFRPNP